MNARDPLLPVQPDESSAIADFAARVWDEEIVPALTDYIAIPAKSPMFDADWARHGHLDRVVRDAAAWVERQQEQIKGLKAQGSGAPKLLIGSRRERSQNEVIDSMGVTLTLPFAGQTHAQAQHLPAQLQLSEAEDSVRREQRAASMAHHEAHHELNARTIALQQLTERLALAEQEIRLTRKAYQLGETSLQERLLGEQRYADIARQHGSARIAQQWAIARFNQVQGVTP